MRDIAMLARTIESDCRSSISIGRQLPVKPVILPHNEYFAYVRGTKTAEELFPVVTRAVQARAGCSCAAQKEYIPEIPSQEEVVSALSLASPELERLAERYQSKVS